MAGHRGGVGRSSGKTENGKFTDRCFAPLGEALEARAAASMFAARERSRRIAKRPLARRRIAFQRQCRMAV